MSKVLIAYNDDSKTDLHEFLESCGDEVRQICVDNHIDYSTVSPPNLTEQSVIGVIQDYQVCFLASHGDSYGIYNENNDAVISTRTTNYNFKDKGFYSVACLCAQELHPHLKACKLLFFVGYNDKFVVRGEREPFIVSALAGLKSFLKGNTLKVAKEDMMKEYETHIDKLENLNDLRASLLLHNREALVFDGDDDLLFSSLK